MESDEEYLETLRILVDQTKNEVKYEEEGLTDEILDKQVEINKKRNKNNILDREEIIYEDKTGEYVQWIQMIGKEMYQHYWNSHICYELLT